MVKGVMAAVPYGDPQRPDVLMGPVISAKQRDRVLGYIDKGIAEGATLALGGGRPQDLDKGWFVEPTLFTDVDNSMTIAQEEIFGPVLVVIPYERRGRRRPDRQRQPVRPVRRRLLRLARALPRRRPPHPHRRPEHQRRQLLRRRPALRRLQGQRRRPPERHRRLRPVPGDQVARLARALSDAWRSARARPRRRRRRRRSRAHAAGATPRPGTRRSRARRTARAGSGPRSEMSSSATPFRYSAPSARAGGRRRRRRPGARPWCSPRRLA